MVAGERLPHRCLPAEAAAIYSANTVPIREQVRDSVEFVRLIWEEIERHLGEEEP